MGIGGGETFGKFWGFCQQLSLHWGCENSSGTDFVFFFIWVFWKQMPVVTMTIGKKTTGYSTYNGPPMQRTCIGVQILVIDISKKKYFFYVQCQSKVVSFCRKLFPDPPWEFSGNCSELELNQVEEAAVHTCTSWNWVYNKASMLKGGYGYFFIWSVGHKK